MKIHVMSDLHLEFGGLTPPATDADIVILAGDIHVKQHAVAWAQKHFACPVVYVLGNHEHYGSSLGRTPRKLKEKALGTNVHVLHNESVVLGGVRILGATLWTDYRITGNQPLAEFDAMQTMSDFKYIRNQTHGRLKPHQVLLEHVASRHYLEQELDAPFQGKTVVVTHHAPTSLSLHPQYLSANSHLNASYASNMDRLMGGERVALWVHGHVHDSFEYDLYGTRVVCNPRGYTPTDLNPNFNPSLVLEV